MSEQVDKPLAEYVMSCLAPAPLSDLVTRDFLSAELAQLVAATAVQREADRAEAAVQREADRAERTAEMERLEARREADRAEAAEMRAADSEEWTRRFRWLIGAFIGMTGCGRQCSVRRRRSRLNCLRAFPADSAKRID